MTFEYSTLTLYIGSFYQKLYSKPKFILVFRFKLRLRYESQTSIVDKLTWNITYFVRCPSNHHLHLPPRICRPRDDLKIKHRNGASFREKDKPLIFAWFFIHGDESGLVVRIAFELGQLFGKTRSSIKAVQLLGKGMKIAGPYIKKNNARFLTVGIKILTSNSGSFSFFL